LGFNALFEITYIFLVVNNNIYHI
jgi:dimethylglycine dehydrogenase